MPRRINTRIKILYFFFFYNRNIAEAQAIFGDDFNFDDINYDDLDDDEEDEDNEDEEEEEDEELEQEEVEPQYDEDGNLIEDVSQRIFYRNRMLN